MLTAIRAATDAIVGGVELATSAEVVTGTDATRVVTPDTLTDKMLAPGSIGGTTPAAGAFTTLDASGITALAGLLKLTQTAQALTGAGAVNITTAITHGTTTAADAWTLIDGAAGQLKVIVMVGYAVGDGTLTPTTLAGGTTITFGAVGDTALLLFTSSSWYMIGGSATIA